MHAYNRLPGSNSGHNSPSPPPSPLRSPRLRHGRSKPGGRFTPGLPPRTPVQRLAWAVLSVLLRRQGIFLFAPLLYIACMLFYMGTVSFDVVPIISHKSAPGSVYRSPQLYRKLRPDMDADNSTSDSVSYWILPSQLFYAAGYNNPQPIQKLDAFVMRYRLQEISITNQYLCRRLTNNSRMLSPVTSNSPVCMLLVSINRIIKICIRCYVGLPESNGYIYVEANGGLNQQRTSICNAVAVAGYLNATLIIPNFHYHSIWRDIRCCCTEVEAGRPSRPAIGDGDVDSPDAIGDGDGERKWMEMRSSSVTGDGDGERKWMEMKTSKFSDIYDEDYFVSTLQNDVRVVDKIPGYLMERYDYNMSNVFNFKIKAYAPIQYYRDTVLPKLLEEKVIRISPFANRLSFDAPPAVQRLRCLANYEALRFSSPILDLGKTLVTRMKEHSANNGGKYVSVHLRFEEDMVAFSCCVYDGGKKEKEDMDAARERGWRGKFTKPGRVIRPGAIRMNGKCPLTPLEVGLMLRGMGFDNNTSIFLASGKIYDSERHMAPLLEMFPLLRTKEMLASPEELEPFKNYSSRMAAIDYTVCLHSEVFVTTQGGNFPHLLLGHRRYMFSGHSKTIRPDKRKLVLYFDNPNIGWKSFKRHMLNLRAHSDSKGIEVKRPTDSIYSFPCPNCMCRVNKTVDSRSTSAT
ncbi:hypothetical protein RJ640_001490 [Escallonia rubra]|uniref:O-fucosyltransferase family protein n=1 Tax=Escallonia rubra TaxID=112253 RepID=A0AA88TY90_9ASTE|nr:hypothetical protein RJ640_001490 [Escallonia rubra]